MRIALRAQSGYLTAEGGGEPQPKRGLVTANRSQVGAWELWTVEPQPGGRVALKSANGQYLCAEGGGGSYVYANRAEVGGWETWTPSQPFADGAVLVLNSDNGRALSASAMGTHIVDAAGEPSLLVATVYDVATTQPTPSGGALSPIHRDGVDIRDAAGKRVVIVETTNFLQFYRVAVRHEDPAPTLYAGFNTDRVTLSMKWVPEQLGWPILDPTDDPAFQSLLHEFLTWKRSIGRRTELTVVCDRRDLGRDQAWAARLLNKTYEVVEDFKENLVEFGNEVEDGEQGLDLPYLVANVNRRGVMSCSGSGLTGMVVPEPYLDYCAPHLTRGPLAKMLGDANFGEQVYGSWTIDGSQPRAGQTFQATRRVMLPNEMKGAGESDSDSRYTDPNIAKEAARAFMSRNGGCFHATDAVFSRPLGPKQETSRAAFIEGASGA